MIDFAKPDEAQRWLEGQPRDVKVAMAARAALRVLPLIVTGLHGQGDPSIFRILVLSCFRVAAASWAGIRPATHDPELRAAATDAYLRALRLDAPVRTYSAAGYAVNAAIHAAAAAADAHDPAIAIARACDADADAGAAADADAAFIEGGETSDEREALTAALSQRPLWPDGTPPRIAKAWSRFKSMLLAREDEDWAVWTDWYDARLAGRRADRDLEIARVLIPAELWGGAEAANNEIRRLIEEYTPPDPIPAQCAGPHFALSPEIKIALAPPGEIDAVGNNMARIGNLLPVVRQTAGDLAGHLNPNMQPEISRIVGDYRAAIAGEPERIAWGIVFGLGVRLENAAAASRREIADRLRDPLEDAPQEALDSLLTLHGPLMLATAAGRELADDADRFVQTREQQAELRRDAQRIAANLKNSPEIIEASAASLGEEAAAAIGEGPHPERGTVFGLATLKHAATIFVPAATLASFVPAGIAAAGLLGAAVGGGVAWAGYESLKKSRRFTAATAALGPVWDRLLTGGEAQAVRVLVRLAPFRNFVARNEEPLRHIAENSTQLRWMLSYIDFVIRSNRPP